MYTKSIFAHLLASTIHVYPINQFSLCEIRYGFCRVAFFALFFREAPYTHVCNDGFEIKQQNQINGKRETEGEGEHVKNSHPAVSSQYMSMSHRL